MVVVGQVLLRDQVVMVEVVQVRLVVVQLVLMEQFHLAVVEAVDNMKLLRLMLVVQGVQVSSSSSGHKT